MGVVAVTGGNTKQHNQQTTYSDGQSKTFIYHSQTLLHDDSNLDFSVNLLPVLCNSDKGS
jgi:hypothetical protein